jgi:hypothetical protein
VLDHDRHIKGKHWDYGKGEKKSRRLLVTTNLGRQDEAVETIDSAMQSGKWFSTLITFDLLEQGRQDWSQGCLAWDGRGVD